jgi:hypothetical protein
VTPADDRRVTSSARVESHGLKKTESLKEDTTKQGGSLANRSTKFSSTRASFTDYQRSSVVTRPPPEQQESTRSLYDYADHIPKPKVIYITDEDRANEMVPGLNG